MDRTRRQFWRGITMAAVLLFAAAQLVEQSHVHAESDALCTVCTHAGGTDGLPTLAQSIEIAPPDVLPAAPQTLQAITTLPVCGNHARAPPHLLS